MIFPRRPPFAGVRAALCALPAHRGTRRGKVAADCIGYVVRRKETWVHRTNICCCCCRCSAPHRRGALFLLLLHFILRRMSYRNPSNMRNMHTQDLRMLFSAQVGVCRFFFFFPSTNHTSAMLFYLKFDDKCFLSTDTMGVRCTL